ncbi:hypothetical protein [uncultured Alistipes sp.]|jgi:hypothetical protein|uniref:hypothetical protein n=1 Tax=uncultured Alistipes sp. TaxID=538949 RepID=UPI0025CBF8AD|nr:hypothetical protein [uncultured Alistipes sp.]
MKFFKSEGWKAFWPNFLAVVLGIAITFGGERVISDSIDQAKARNVVSRVKESSRKKLANSEMILKDLEDKLQCVTRVFESYDGKRIDGVTADTLELFVGFFYGFYARDAYMYDASIQDMVTSSECLRIIDDPEVVTCVTNTCALARARWEILQKIYDEQSRIYEHLREQINYRNMQRVETEEEYVEKMAHILLADDLCWSAIFDERFAYYINMARELDALTGTYLDRLEQAGF